MDKVKTEKKDYFGKPRIYRELLPTAVDLNDFKKQLVFDIKILLKDHVGQPSKKYLKSKNVRKLLNISPWTLQNLRVIGTLSYSQIGGVIYHDAEDIQEMLKSKTKSAN
jgi:hypothetical protein